MVSAQSQVCMTLSNSMAVAQYRLSTGINSKNLEKPRILDDLIVLNLLKMSYKFPLLTLE